MQCRGDLQQVKLFWTVRKGDYESQPSKHNLIQTDPVPLQDIREVRNVWDLCDRSPQPSDSKCNPSHLGYRGFSALGIPQGGTHIPEFGCPGIHVIQELPVHCHPCPDLRKDLLNPQEPHRTQRF